MYFTYRAYNEKNLGIYPKLMCMKGVVMINYNKYHGKKNAILNAYGSNITI